jgi:hypothetical protein
MQLSVDGHRQAAGPPRNVRWRSRRWHRIAGAGLVLLLVSACAQTSAPKWYRLDGRSIPSDASLLQQAQTDYTICRGEAQKINAVAPVDNSATVVGIMNNLGRGDAVRDVFAGCMAQRGYVLR